MNYITFNTALAFVALALVLLGACFVASDIAGDLAAINPFADHSVSGVLSDLENFPANLRD